MKLFTHEIVAQCDSEGNFWQCDDADDPPGVFSFEGNNLRLFLVEINAKEFPVGCRLRITIEKVEG